MLNEAQTKGVNANNPRIVCLAGAGTGKSTTLLSRISRLIKDGVAPSSILALTFTNAAAFEMKDRFATQNADLKSTPEFRTFHSFCYHLITVDENIRKTLGYTNVPSIADSFAEKRILQEAKLQTGIKLSDAKITGKSDSPLSQDEAYQLMLLLKAADRLMKQKGLITFDKLSKEVSELFVKDNGVVAKYKSQYKHLLIDEYQDTDTTQHDFVMSFKDSCIFVVGDALQNLYSFRGTSSDMIKSLSEDPEWLPIKLYENYRSTKQICEYANKYSKAYAKESYRIAINSDRAGEAVSVRHYSAYLKGAVPAEVTESIVNECKALNGTTAILVRTNSEVASIQDYLVQHKIPFMSKGTNKVGHHILRSVLDDNYAVEWLASLLSSESYSEYIRRATIKKQSSRPYSLGDLISEFGSNKDIKLNVDKLYTVRRICKKTATLAEKERSILKALGYTSKIKVDTADIETLSDYMKALADAIEDYVDTDSMLYVGTVHSVKGLEYDNVYVVGPRSRSWPLNSEDNHNIFYVAVTRAKTNLTIYFAE